MQKLKSSITNMVLVLVGVSVIMGAVLAAVNNATAAAVAEQEKKTLADGIKAVMGGMEVQVKEDKPITQEFKGKEYNFVAHIVNDMNGGYLGAAVESTIIGFGGDLKVLVGFDAEGKVLGYTLLAHAETPGLGAKADQWFQKGQKGDIIGKTPGSLSVTKDGGEIDAITASTITSRAFLNAVNQAYQAYIGKATDANTGATSQQK